MKKLSKLETKKIGLSLGIMILGHTLTAITTLSSFSFIAGLAVGYIIFTEVVKLKGDN